MPLLLQGSILRSMNQWDLKLIFLLYNPITKAHHKYWHYTSSIGIVLFLVYVPVWRLNLVSTFLFVCGYYLLTDILLHLFSVFLYVLLKKLLRCYCTTYNIQVNFKVVWEFTFHVQFLHIFVVYHSCLLYTSRCV